MREGERRKAKKTAQQKFLLHARDRERKPLSPLFYFLKIFYLISIKFRETLKKLEKCQIPHINKFIQ